MSDEGYFFAGVVKKRAPHRTGNSVSDGTAVHSTAPTGLSSTVADTLVAWITRQLWWYRDAKQALANFLQPITFTALFSEIERIRVLTISDTTFLIAVFCHLRRCLLLIHALYLCLDHLSYRHYCLPLPPWNLVGLLWWKSTIIHSTSWASHLRRVR